MEEEGQSHGARGESCPPVAGGQAVVPFGASPAVGESPLEPLHLLFRLSLVAGGGVWHFGTVSPRVCLLVGRLPEEACGGDAWDLTWMWFVASALCPPFLWPGTLPGSDLSQESQTPGPGHTTPFYS